jgi:hypothetical protein
MPSGAFLYSAAPMVARSGSEKEVDLIVADRRDEETDNPFYADDRNFYKVEKIRAHSKVTKSPAMAIVSALSKQHRSS